MGSGATTQSGSRTGEYDGSGAWSGPFGPVGRDIEGDSGGYSRFFLIPKADRAERERGLAGAQTARANTHPTVKPIDLMRHLVRLVTPPGGTVLDPFLGSGSTALAASEEGVKCIGIEREPEYVQIAVSRLIATPMGLGLDVPAPTPTRSASTGHWPKERTPGKDGWGFTGQTGLEERYDKPDEEPAA